MPIQNSKLVHALLIVPSLLQMLQLLKDIALIIRLIHEMLFIGGIFEVHRKCKIKHEIVYGMENTVVGETLAVFSNKKIESFRG